MQTGDHSVEKENLLVHSISNVSIIVALLAVPVLPDRHAWLKIELLSWEETIALDQCHVPDTGSNELVVERLETDTPTPRNDWG
ncbi:unnamed protein product [Caretta caretta]